MVWSIVLVYLFLYLFGGGGVDHSPEKRSERAMSPLAARRPCANQRRTVSGRNKAGPRVSAGPRIGGE